MGSLPDRHQPDADDFYAAVAAAELAPDTMMRVEIDGRSVLIANVAGEFYAFSAVCPHGGGDLSRGSLHRGRLDCPDHGYRFDIRSGRPVWPEDEVCRLKRFPVRLEAGLVMVQVI